MKLSKLIETVEKATGKKIVLQEAIKFPEWEFDYMYKSLIKLAQTKPKWDEKPNYKKTTATHTIEGKINGKVYYFSFNVPGAYSSIYRFSGLSDDENNAYSDKGELFSDSGKAIDSFMDKKIAEVAKEKNLKTGMPMTWLIAAKSLKGPIVLKNVKEFEKAIYSLS